MEEISQTQRLIILVILILGDIKVLWTLNKNTNVVISRKVPSASQT